MTRLRLPIRQRAFTMMELMVALSIAAVIIAAGASAVQGINYSIQDTKKRAAIWDQAKRVEEFIISQMQGAGGGVIRPFEVIRVDNNFFGCVDVPGLPPCDTHNRIELQKVAFALPQCRVSAASGINLHVDDDVPGHCCLDVVVVPPAPPESFDNRYAILLTDAGKTIPLYLQSKSGCDIQAPPGKGNNPGSLNAEVPGTLVAVDQMMFLVDAPRHELVQWRDKNGDRAASGGERRDLHSGVYDMQVALGYDGAPEDGRERDDNSENDEWRFNVVTDPDFGFRSFLTVTPDQLRMVQVGIVVGGRARIGSDVPVQLLDGPINRVPGFMLAGTTSKAYLRNVSVFSQ